MVMCRFQLRKEECSRWGNDIPSTVNKKIKENSVECRILRTLHSGQEKITYSTTTLRRKPGRPKLLRKRESTKKPKAARSGSVVCGKCKLPRHNSRTCKTKGSPAQFQKASKKQPTVSEDEGAASSSKPSKKVVTTMAYFCCQHCEAFAMLSFYICNAWLVLSILGGIWYH
ncbi:hypothetical protein Q3G72_031377 [Acer saccharum]|nr:hypothetical protein Q3G72_031377 [Acer saccharum]